MHRYYDTTKITKLTKVGKEDVVVQKAKKTVDNNEDIDKFMEAYNGFNPHLASAMNMDLNKLMAAIAADDHDEEGALITLKGKGKGKSGSTGGGEGGGKGEGKGKGKGKNKGDKDQVTDATCWKKVEQMASILDKKSVVLASGLQ